MSMLPIRESARPRPERLYWRSLPDQPFGERRCGLEDPEGSIAGISLSRLALGLCLCLPFGRRAACGEALYGAAHATGAGDVDGAELVESAQRVGIEADCLREVEADTRAHELRVVPLAVDVLYPEALVAVGFPVADAAAVGEKGM